MELLIVLGLVILALAFLYYLYISLRSRCNSLINNWALKNNFRLIRWEMIWGWKLHETFPNHAIDGFNKFYWPKVICKFHVEDEGKNQKSGYALFHLGEDKEIIKWVP